MRPEASAPLQTARFATPGQSGIIPLPLRLFVSRSPASSWANFLIVHSVVRVVYNTVVLGEAHASLAFCLDLFDWDWKSAELEFKRAIDLSPSYATAHQWYAWHLIVTGQHDEGVSELRKAEALDPLSLIIGADIADALLVAHRYDESMKQSRKTIEMDPSFAMAHYEFGQAAVQIRKYNEAVQELQQARELSGGN